MDVTCMIVRLAATVSLVASLLFSSLALAQAGSLNYGPIGQAVPTGSGPLLVLLGVLLGGFGMLALHLRNKGRGMGTLLVMASSIIVLGGSLYVQNAGAPQVSVELDNPTGGSVTVPVGPMTYINTSGVVLRINAISEPCEGGINTAGNACAVKQLLADNAECESNFACPQPETCDGVDNNFNNAIDEGVTPPLGTSCSGGAPVCAGTSGWICPPSCSPDCSGKQCGDDGCGGSCGSCGGGQVCNLSGLCESPPPV